MAVPGKYSIPVLDRVKLRRRDDSGNPIGEKQRNPILYTRVYELELPDGLFNEHVVNIIIDNLID